MKLKYLFLLIALFGVAFANAQKVVFTPQWSAQTQFAGYYMANAKGYYKARGLTVEIVYPSRSENAFYYLKSGKAQFVTMNLSQAIYYKVHGADIVNVMQTSQVNSLMLVSHFPLPNFAALQNRKLGIWNYLNQDFVNAVLSKYGVRANLVRFNSGVNVFLSGAVDVCLIGSYNEYPQLLECGYKVDPAYMMRLSDWGYKMPEEGVYVLRSYYEKNKETVKKFVEASKQGWQYTAGHTTEAVNYTMKYIRQYHIGTNSYHQRLMLDEVLRLQKDSRTGKRTFVLSPKDFETAMGFVSSRSIKYNDFVK